MASIEYSQVRKGMVILGDDGQLYTVVDRDLNTPGNWRAILQLKLKNLNTGSIATNRVRPQDKVEQAYLDHREMEYIYKEGDGYVFMDTETFDQITLSREWVGDLMLYMKEGNKAQVVFYDTKPISLDLPATIELKVVETEPALKGATAAAQYKPATMETGLKISVPPFIGIGEMLAIDTGAPASTSAERRRNENRVHPRRPPHHPGSDGGAHQLPFSTADEAVRREPCLHGAHRRRGCRPARSPGLADALHNAAGGSPRRPDQRYRPHAHGRGCSRRRGAGFQPGRSEFRVPDPAASWPWRRRRSSWPIRKLLVALSLSWSGRFPFR